MWEIDLADSGPQKLEEAETMSGDYIIGGRKEDHEQVAKSTPKISMDSPKEFLRHTTVAALFPGRTQVVLHH
jgi:hypothetical protein